MERFSRSQQGDAASDGNVGSSSGGSSDLHPENAYGTDLRYLDTEEKNTANKANTSNQSQKNKVRHYMDAAKAAGKYRQHALIDEPALRGNTPRVEASIKGTNVPTLGDKVGIAGSTNYAQKPGATAGKFTGFF
jgi:hypothetical protein